MGQGVIERPTQPLPSFLCSPPSPLSLTGCPGRPPQPTLLRPSSVPFSSSAVAVPERRPARHWPLLAAAPTSRPGKRRDQRPASYRAPLACLRPLAAAPMPRPGARRRTNVQPATGPPSPAFGLFWPLPRCPGLAQDVEPTSSQLPGPPCPPSASSGRCLRARFSRARSSPSVALQGPSPTVLSPTN